MTPKTFIDKLRVGAQKALARSKAWTPEENIILQTLVWAPANIQKRSDLYVAGVMRGMLALISTMSGKVSEEIKTLLWMAGEATEIDAPVPDDQVQAALTALDALHARG
ncbi:hypothetical protein D869_gp125 [Caulobacter phage CcrRogue]|uniref:Uncharacterized protein n=1 Tax=Caulobacter phage CcrRogue TaxID=2927986 RepID=K4JNI2_9CAUD|nr:hypothetical protein D869_gp125 [Caulobacter phage CcrRogue]AFU86789.1 hypothetical protein CcrRogue_gp307 [Caulobacter phage CcrRogue]